MWQNEVGVCYDDLDPGPTSLTSVQPAFSKKEGGPHADPMEKAPLSVAV